MLDFKPIFQLAGLLGCLAVACKNDSKTGPTERLEHFETGQLSRRTPLINGKKEGKMTDFYPDGKPMAERIFKNDLQEGRTVIFHKNGQLKEVQYFERGLRNGGDTLWYETGKIEFASWFVNGKKQGFLQKWSPEGNLIFQAVYEQDVPVEINGQPVK